MRLLPHLVSVSLFAACAPAVAQQQSATPPPHDMGDMPGMDHAAMGHAGMTHEGVPPPAPVMDHAAMGHAMAGMPTTMAQSMPAMLGPYAMTREASGTAWQPDSTPMRGAMFHVGGWMLMGEGYATLVYDKQGGPRGAAKTFSESMAMLMAMRDVSPADRIGLRAMVSLDPAMGPSGYPLLFATGESADGREPLVDRQHPHDLFMELAASWAHDLGHGRAFSLYAGLPGEPALGPPTFMHRQSGQDNPEAPIGHHWFDSTHITFGVVTAGFSARHWKIEASAFRGREPDQHRWDVESPKLDSWSVRGFWNPTANLSLQLSTGHLHSPEALEPTIDEQRTTASASLNLPLGGSRASRRNFAATIAWSAKDLRPGPTLHAWLGEAALQLGRNELYGRVEHVQENELFHHGPLAGWIFPVTKLSLGLQHERPAARHVYAAFGLLGSVYDYADALRADYGREGAKSLMAYARLRFGN